MKEYKDVIHAAITKLQDLLLDGVPLSNRDALVESFEKFLLPIYDEIYVKYVEKNGEDAENGFIEFIKKNEIFFLKLPARDKMDLLLYAPSFERIQAIGAEAQDMAWGYKKTKDKDPAYESRKKRILDALEKEKVQAEDCGRVLDFLEYELSEVMLELDFAGGVSKRMSRRMREKVLEE